MINNDALDHVLAFASLLAVFVMSVVQLVKITFRPPKRWIPLIGVGLGLLIGAAAYPFSTLDLAMRLWSGALAGLSATGLFELAFNNRDSSKK